jgi:arylsulfatase A-like enzyme
VGVVGIQRPRCYDASVTPMQETGCRAQQSNRLLFVLGALQYAIFLLLAGCSADHDGDEPASSSPNWNVVLLTLDTVRADALGVYGQPFDTTPNIDRVAREGVLFEQVVSAAPHTLASHASIFTGLFPFSHGVRGNQGFVLASENVTLAEILASHGYQTVAEIAAPVLRSGTRIAQGFGQARESDAPHAETKSRAPMGLGEGGLVRSAENISQRGIDFIRSNHERPFFLWLHYFDAHLPYSKRPELKDKIPDSAYLREVAAVDLQVSRVFEALEEAQIREHTLVIITGDHGEGLGEHGEPTHSFFVYETTMRVPLILWGPRSLPQGHRISSIVRTVDILPTVLDLLGLPSVHEIHGRSLTPLIRGQAEDLDLVGYGEALDLYRIFGTTPLRLLRKGRWKYIHKVNPELFDLTDDPAELIDRGATHPEVVADLDRSLRELLAVAPKRSGNATVEVSAEEEAQLRALGYLAATAPTPLADEITMLESAGPDPTQLASAIERISKAKGHLTARKWQRAIDRLGPVLAEHPTSGTANGLMAKAFAGLGDADRAIAFYERAIELEGDACSHLRLDYARALEGFDRHRERLEMISEGLSLCPDSGTYRNELAWALATCEDPSLRDGARALEVANQLVIRGEGEPDPNHLDTLAAAYAAVGDSSSAAREQWRAVKILERAAADPQLIRTYRATARKYAETVEQP